MLYLRAAASTGNAFEEETETIVPLAGAAEASTIAGAAGNGGAATSARSLSMNPVIGLPTGRSAL